MRSSGSFTTVLDVLWKRRVWHGFEISIINHFTGNMTSELLTRVAQLHFQPLIMSPSVTR